MFKVLLKALLSPAMDFFRGRKRAKYLKRLKYALERMNNPYYDEINERDRKYRLKAIHWLYLYYQGDPDIRSEGPPELKMKKTLSLPTSDVSKKDFVFVRILAYWIEHKRIEGL
jgi:hypothetical protein